jgi:hypothetical protein
MNLLAVNPSYLNKVLASSQRGFSVAFNVRSKFEEAYLKKKAGQSTQARKE